MDTKYNNNTQNRFLNRFSDDRGSLDGVAVNTDNEKNIAVGSVNEQKAEENITDVRNTSGEGHDHSEGNAPASCEAREDIDKRLWSFLDMDNRFSFDIEGVKNTARDHFASWLLKSWEKQANELLEKYPDFDLGCQVKNKSFLAMLRCGIPMDLAYKALNYDEILEAEVHRALELFYADFKIRGSRPCENGLISGGGVSIGMGAKAFSRKERADIARRVEKGEKISL